MTESTEQQTTPAPTDKADKTARFAAYDTTYERFVGGVHDTQAKARKAAKDEGAKTVEIREV